MKSGVQVDRGKGVEEVENSAVAEAREEEKIVDSSYYWGVEEGWWCASARRGVGRREKARYRVQR